MCLVKLTMRNTLPNNIIITGYSCDPIISNIKINKLWSNVFTCVYSLMWDRDYVLRASSHPTWRVRFRAICRVLRWKFNNIIITYCMLWWHLWLLRTVFAYWMHTQSRCPLAMHSFCKTYFCNRRTRPIGFGKVVFSSNSRIFSTDFHIKTYFQSRGKKYINLHITPTVDKVNQQ